MSENIDLVMEFLQKNRFAKAEAALRGELTGRGDSNGLTTQRRMVDPKEDDEQESSEVGSSAGLLKGAASVRSTDSSREFIVKEIDIGAMPNGSDGRKGSGGISQPQENNMGDLYPLNFSIANSMAEQLAELLVLEEVPRHRRGQMVTEKRDRGVGTEQPGPMLEQVSYGRGKGKVDAAGRSEINDQGHSRDKNLVPEKEELLNGCTVKTLLPFPAENPSSSYNSTYLENERKEIKKGINADVGKAAKGQIDDGIRQYYFEKSQDQVADRCFDLQLVGDNQREEFPKLPPVRLKSEDKLVNMNWEEKINHHGSGTKQSTDDHTLMIGSFLDVPIGHEITSSGMLLLTTFMICQHGNQYDTMKDLGPVWHNSQLLILRGAVSNIVESGEMIFD
jgi:hypothetical protein